MMALYILATAGLCISLYSFFVEQKIKENEQYKPACDLSDRVSCTKVMRSEYTNLFYVSNSILGALYYLGIIVFTYFQVYTIVALMASAALLLTLYLAYLLIFKIHSLCLVCTSLYVINGLIFLVIILHRYPITLIR